MICFWLGFKWLVVMICLWLGFKWLVLMIFFVKCCVCWGLWSLGFRVWKMGKAYSNLYVHVYVYIYICICICIYICMYICIFVSYYGWLPINHYIQVAWNRPRDCRRPTPTRPWSRRSTSCEWQTQWRGRRRRNFDQLIGFFPTIWSSWGFLDDEQMINRWLTD